MSVFETRTAVASSTGLAVEPGIAAVVGIPAIDLEFAQRLTVRIGPDPSLFDAGVFRKPELDHVTSGRT